MQGQHSHDGPHRLYYAEVDYIMRKHDYGSRHREKDCRNASKKKRVLYPPPRTLPRSRQNLSGFQAEWQEWSEFGRNIISVRTHPNLTWTPGKFQPNSNHSNQIHLDPCGSQSNQIPHGFHLESNQIPHGIHLESNQIPDVSYDNILFSPFSNIINNLKKNFFFFFVNRGN